jgi:hypothetical protein
VGSPAVTGISWIVATHDQQILQRSLLPTVPLDDELVVIEQAPSIAVAYNEGTARASHRIRAYIHHDVAIVDPDRLRHLLFEACTGVHGIVGVIGSLTPVVPWWNGEQVGSVVDTRAGRLGPGGFGDVAYLDGLLLATAQDLQWDETYPGWHLYDHDICQQQLAAGLTNVCLPDGHELVRHETAGPWSLNELNGWKEGVDVFQAKWGSAASYA